MVVTSNAGDASESIGEVLRTPDSRFEGLSDYPFEPHYASVGKIRVHYIDEGPKDTAPVLLLHGEPSWSYLYRHMIPILVEGGHRVIVPDLVGFGKSDKPKNRDDYTYQRHIEWMDQLVFGHLQLDEITFFGQDWGGLIGLRLVAGRPDRFARLVVANTGLPTGVGEFSEAFMKWRKYSQEVPEFPVGKIIQRATTSELTPAQIAAYDAPFPEEEYKAGARVFPLLVPIAPDTLDAVNNREAWTVLSAWEKPCLTLFSDSDPITRGGEKVFQERVPGAKEQDHRIIESAGHFLQEDQGPQLARLINEFISNH